MRIKKILSLCSISLLFFTLGILFYMPQAKGQDMTNTYTYYDDFYFDSPTFQTYDFYDTSLYSPSKYYNYGQTLGSTDYLSGYDSSYFYFSGLDIFNPFGFIIPWIMPYPFSNIIMIEKEEEYRPPLHELIAPWHDDDDFWCDDGHYYEDPWDDFGWYPYLVPSNWIVKNYQIF